MAKQPSGYCDMSGADTKYLGHMRRAKHLNRGHNDAGSLDKKDKEMDQAAGLSPYDRRESPLRDTEVLRDALKQGGEWVVPSGKDAVDKYQSYEETTRKRRKAN